jgi:hypothetical protein
MNWRILTRAFLYASSLMPSWYVPQYFIARWNTMHMEIMSKIGLHLNEQVCFDKKIWHNNQVPISNVACVFPTKLLCMLNKPVALKTHHSSHSSVKLTVLCPTLYIVQTVSYNAVIYFDTARLFYHAAWVIKNTETCMWYHKLKYRIIFTVRVFLRGFICTILI